MQTAISCTLMRGGTSRGLYFLADDLPMDIATRDRVLLAAFGSPDVRQIDGVGGANPLTSKVAVVSRSSHPDADVDYLFLQVAVDLPQVSDNQNCGNLLAGVAQFAIEKKLVRASDITTDVRIHMRNSGSISVARVQTPAGCVAYAGTASIDGVPGTAAPVMLAFENIAGANCGALLPTGAVRDTVDGIDITCIDNGMPVVILAAANVGKTGYETPAELEADKDLKACIESIRLQIGEKMNLGDVTDKTVPKMCLIAPPNDGGTICTRTFIPHRIHEAVGVLGAVSVATACVMPGSVAADIAVLQSNETVARLTIEHPSGSFIVELEFEFDDRDRDDGEIRFRRVALLRTARKIMSGQIYVPATVWKGNNAC